ncbi:hypothetical protein N665_0064s0046 [Sinapis alba]|nr:hypothetical protein N665_0064s0046 [Sinapis alba]
MKDGSSSLESDKTASKKKKKHRTSKESRNSSLFDEPGCSLEEEDDGWLLGAKLQEDVSTKSTMNEDVVMNMHKLDESCFPRSQLLSGVGVFFIAIHTKRVKRHNNTSLF